MILEHPADLDRAGRRKSAVGVDEQRDLVAERLADGGNDLLRPARPLVDVAAAFGPDPELERIEAVIVTKTLEPFRLGLRRDVPFHRRGIGPQRTRVTADQRADAFAGALAGEVEKRGVEPGNRPIKVGSGKLVLAQRDDVDQAVDVGSIGAERPRRHLAMEDERGDVGVIGRHLPPAL